MTNEHGKLRTNADFRNGVRFAISWLHARALEMNDPHARAILNSAGYNLGLDLPNVVVPDAGRSLLKENPNG